MFMLQQFSITRAAVALAIVTCIGASSAAKGQSQTDFAEMASELKRLAARVAALEDETKQAKKEAAEARAQAHALQQKVDSASPTPRAPTAPPITLAPTTPAAIPAGLHAMATKAPSLALMPNKGGWSGMYVGASFGMGAGSSKTTGQETNRFNAPLNSPPSDLFIGTVVTNASANLAPGAFADLFIGVNSQLGERLVVGAQAEGTVGYLSFGLKGTKSYAYFDSSGSVLPTGNNASVDQQIHSLWLVSGLIRGGWLLNQDTLFYGIGGWTVAQFYAPAAAFNPRVDSFQNGPISFIGNGPTLGFGIEHKLAANWSLRAEYRYTYFMPQTVTTTSTFSGPNTVNGVDVSQMRYQSNLNSVRLGTSYQF